MRLIIVIIILLILSGVVVAQFDRVEATGELRADVAGLMPAEEAGPFATADRVRPITFPADWGAHPAYRTEWWYYTGNLAGAGGDRFGFQLTFFRRALTPARPERASEWATNQIYFAHFALTDVAGDAFNSFERFSRGSANLAGAQSDPYHVWIDDWLAQEVGPGQVQLRARAGDFGLDLTLEQAKPAALHGQQGLSQKSRQPGNASYYYSLTNNRTRGSITTPRGTFAVTGKTWKDHEWGTSDLPPGTVGWDWFSLQLDDQREVMFFIIRRQEGGVEPSPTGTLVAADGSSRTLSEAEVKITPLGRWTSPYSGATYPSGWRFQIPGEQIDLTITPLLPQQELQVSFVYWEGAVKIEGTQTGYGYVELTGYYETMRGRF